MNPSRSITPVLWVLLVVFAAGPALAETSGSFTFANADIQTVVKQVATVTGITFLFDPEQVKGRITLLPPKDKDVSPTESSDDACAGGP